MQLTVNAKINCVRKEDDGTQCRCCKNGPHAFYRKLDLIDHNIPDYLPPDLLAWLNQQIDFTEHDGKLVKVTFEIEDEPMPKIPELESPDAQIAENFYGKLLDLHLEVEAHLENSSIERLQRIKALSAECRKLRDYYLGTRYQ